MWREVTMVVRIDAHKRADLALMSRAFVGGIPQFADM